MRRSGMIYADTSANIFPSLPKSIATIIPFAICHLAFTRQSMLLHVKLYKMLNGLKDVVLFGLDAIKMIHEGARQRSPTVCVNNQHIARRARQKTLAGLKSFYLAALLHAGTSRDGPRLASLPRVA